MSLSTDVQHVWESLSIVILGAFPLCHLQLGDIPLLEHRNAKIPECPTAPREVDGTCKSLVLWEGNLEFLSRGISSGFGWQKSSVPSPAPEFPPLLVPTDPSAPCCCCWGAEATSVFQDPVPAIIPPKPQSYFCFLPPTLSISPLANIDFPQFPAALIKQLPKGLPRGPLLLFVEQKNHQHCLQSAPASAAWDQDAELPLLAAGSKGIAEKSCAPESRDRRAPAEGGRVLPAVLQIFGFRQFSSP